jgi:acyl dehydratase
VPLAQEGVPMTTFDLQDLAAHVGEEVGASDWLVVDQARIQQFADATDDQQWIHVDPARASDGPYGATIAHGYLTLSLLPVLVQQVFAVGGVARRVNYGLDKARFPSPVVVGSRVRVVVSIRSVVPVDGGIHLGLRCVVEIEGADRPACVAETVTLLHA